MASLFPWAVLAEAGLVSHWRLGEGSGTTAADAKGVNPGSYKNAPTLGVTGALVGDGNTAITLNGTNQYVNVPDSASLDVGDTLSVLAWIKRSASGGADCIVDKGPNAFIHRFDGEDRWLFRRNSVGDIVKSTIKITNDGKWHFLAGVKNAGTSTKLYHGVPGGSLEDVTGTVTNQTLTNTAIALSIGASETGTEDFFRGSIDEVAIYNIALSAEQVQRIFQAGVAPAPQAALLGVGR